MRHLGWLAVAAMFVVTGCDSFKSKSDEPPARAPLTRQLNLIGKDGNHYGTLELDPVSGGRVYDADGRLIGTVVTPAPGTGGIQ